MPRAARGFAAFVFMAILSRLLSLFIFLCLRSYGKRVRPLPGARCRPGGSGAPPLGPDRPCQRSVAADDLAATPCIPCRTV